MGLVLCTKSELRCLLQLHRFWINMYPQGNEGLYGSRVVCGQIRYRNWTCLDRVSVFFAHRVDHCDANAS